MRRRILLLALLALANGAPPAIRIKVQPVIAQAPSEVHATVFVTRHPDNRNLDLTISGENYEMRSVKQLDGDGAPAVFEFWYHQVPCGNYLATARVQRSSGWAKQTEQKFRLLGFGCDDPTGEDSHGPSASRRQGPITRLLDDIAFELHSLLPVRRRPRLSRRAQRLAELDAVYREARPIALMPFPKGHFSSSRISMGNLFARPVSSTSSSRHKSSSAEQAAADSRGASGRTPTWLCSMNTSATSAESSRHRRKRCSTLTDGCTGIVPRDSTASAPSTRHVRRRRHQPSGSGPLGPFSRTSGRGPFVARLAP